MEGDPFNIGHFLLSTTWTLGVITGAAIAPVKSYGE